MTTPSLSRMTIFNVGLWVLPTEGLPDISDEIAVELVSFKV